MDAADKPTNQSTPRVVHVVKLEGLAPATAYLYRVRSVGGIWSPPHTFTTLPAQAQFHINCL